MLALLLKSLVSIMFALSIVWIVRSRVRAAQKGTQVGESRAELQLNGITGVIAIICLGAAMLGDVLESPEQVLPKLEALGVISLVVHTTGLLVFQLLLRNAGSSPPRS